MSPILRLVLGGGVCVAKTGGPLHWSVWGHPAVLQAAVAALTVLVRAEPEAADDIFLVAQDDEGNMVGETIYGSSLHVTA
jgi:hypothetical protein